MIDRIIIKEGIKSRLFDSFESALRLSDGYAIADVIGETQFHFLNNMPVPFVALQLVN